MLDKIEQAQSIVNDYGVVLARLKHVNTALPNSLLPHDKASIQKAIHTLLWELDDLSPGIKDGLIQAYVYLEQFIPNQQVEILARGQAAIQSADPEHIDWIYADDASRIVNEIKLAMENALAEMRIFLPGK